MTPDENELYETLEENEQYLYDFIEILHKTLSANPNTWQSFIKLTSPLMAEALKLIIAQGQKFHIPSELPTVNG